MNTWTLSFLRLHRYPAIFFGVLLSLKPLLGIDEGMPPQVPSASKHFAPLKDYCSFVATSLFKMASAWEEKAEWTVRPPNDIELEFIAHDFLKEMSQEEKRLWAQKFQKVNHISQVSEPRILVRARKAASSRMDGHVTGFLEYEILKNPSTNSALHPDSDSFVDFSDDAEVFSIDQEDFDWSLEKEKEKYGTSLITEGEFSELESETHEWAPTEDFSSEDVESVLESTLELNQIRSSSLHNKPFFRLVRLEADPNASPEKQKQILRRLFDYFLYLNSDRQRLITPHAKRFAIDATLDPRSPIYERKMRIFNEIFGSHSSLVRLPHGMRYFFYRYHFSPHEKKIIHTFEDQSSRD